jgi:hypothetical protein
MAGGKKVVVASHEIHWPNTPHRKEEEVKTNRTTWWKSGVDHWHQLHALSTFFIYEKYHIAHKTKKSLRKNQYKIMNKPLWSSFWKFNSNDKRDITL